MQSVLVKPIITEKSIADATQGKYLFVVALKASKYDIKKAIADSFNVHAEQITTSIIKGKRKRIGAKKQEVHESLVKKAIVRVKKGEKIGLFEQQEVK